MSTQAELLVGLVLLIGLIGIIVPILPGTILVFGAIAVWAVVESSVVGWTVFGITTALLVVSGVIKYTWPGRKLKDAGVPSTTIILGGILGIVGFFVIPVVGLIIGFLLGVFIAELLRLGTTQVAWRSTIHATKAVGLSILVELLGALLASGVWLTAAIAT